MQKLLLLAILVISLSADELSNLTTKQLATMHWVFNKGKTFNLEYTLTAIAWEESQFGKFNINLNDPSCGIFHIMPRSLIVRTDLSDTSWNRSRLCERLMIDNEFSLSAAILELKYWKNYWQSKGVPRVWSHTVASYNGGFKATLNSPYLLLIKEHIKQLKRIYNVQNRQHGV